MCEVVTAHISWDHVESESVSRSFVSNSLQPRGLRPARFLCPWNSPGKNTGVGCHSFLQGNLPDPGIKPESPILQADSLLSEPPGKPRTMLGRSSMSCWGETLLHGDWMVSTWLDSYARGSFWKQGEEWIRALLLKLWSLDHEYKNHLETFNNANSCLHLRPAESDNLSVRTQNLCFNNHLPPGKSDAPKIWEPLD